MMTSKKITAVMLSVVIAVMMMPQSAFAAYGIDREQIVSERVANEIEQVTGTDEIISNSDEDFNSFDIDMGDVEVEVPKDADEEVVFFDAESDEEIGISLPEDVSDEDLIKTDDGSFVANSEDNDVSVSVQVGGHEDLDTGELNPFVRNVVCIESCEASHSYDFAMDLPDGYNMLLDSQLVKRQGFENFEQDGSIYILDGNSMPVYIVDAPWAVDNDGNNLNTYYTVKENVITQHVDFDKNTAFPVIADPHYGKSKTEIYKKNQLAEKTGCVSGQCPGGYASKTGMLLYVDLDKGANLSVSVGSGLSVSFPVGELARKGALAKIPATGAYYKIYDTKTVQYNVYKISRQRCTVNHSGASQNHKSGHNWKWVETGKYIKITEKDYSHKLTAKKV